MKKKILPLITISCSVICGLVLTLNTKKSYFLNTKASNPTYEISFNSTKNKFHSYTGNTAYDGTATIKTDLGNDIAFSYYQVKGVASTWHVLGDGGYFYNSDPIHGISSIDLSFKTDNKTFDIYYSADLTFDNHQSFTSSTSSSTTFYFNNYFPNYFKIVNTSGANFNISSINVTLSCEQNYPTLYISSENETMGSVSGNNGILSSGTTATINATPNAGYRFVAWFDENNNIVSNNASYTFAMGNEDLSYIARFTYESYNLVVQSESLEKGTVSNSSGAYDYLSNVSISAFANEGYSFCGWYEDNSLVSLSNPYVFEMPYANKTYIARFTVNSYTLKLNNLNSTLGSITGMGEFFYKQNVTIIAATNTGVSFLGWFDNFDNLISSNSTYSFEMPHENLEFNAKFAWTPYEITLNTNIPYGSVTGNGCYIYQQEVTLTATPVAHYSFAGWYDGINLVSKENPFVFNMPDNSLNYEARFVQNHYIYVYSDDESKGSVSAPVECGEGFEVTVNANALLGYALDYWYDDDLNEVSCDSSYTFTMPEEDVSLYASFTTGYTLSVSSSDETKGTVTGGGQYKAGYNVTVNMNYISGSFKGWFDVNNNLISELNSYSFVMPSSNYSLQAKFVVQGENDDYEIVLDHDNTPDTITSSYQNLVTGFVTTINGNNIEFSFVNAKVCDNGFVELAPHGKIFNFGSTNSELNNVTSISFTGTGSFKFKPAAFRGILPDISPIHVAAFSSKIVPKCDFFEIEAGDNGAIISTLTFSYSSDETTNDVRLLNGTYTGVGSDSYRYKLTLNNGSATLTSLNKTPNETINGSITLNSKTSFNIKFSDLDVDFIFDGHALTYVSKSGSSSSLWPDLSLSRVYNVEDFESYNETGQGYTNSETKYQTTGLKSQYYADYYSSYYTGSSEIGGSYWAVQEARDNITFSESLGHNGSKVGIFKFSNGSRIRFISINELYGVQRLIGKGQTLSFWTRGAYTNQNYNTNHASNTPLKFYLYYDTPLTPSNQTIVRETYEATVQSGSEWQHFEFPITEGRNYLGFGFYAQQSSGSTQYLPIDDIKIYSSSPY